MKEFLEKYGEAFNADPKSYRKFLQAVISEVSGIVLYIALALVVALAIWAVVVRNKDESYLSSTRKIMLGVVLGFSFGVIAVLGTFKLYAETLDEDFNLANLLLIVGLFVLVLVAVFTCYALRNRSWKKWLTLGFAVAVAAYVVVLLCVVQPADSSYTPGVPTYDETLGTFVSTQGSSWLMYLVCGVLVAAIVVLALLGNKGEPFDTRSLTYAAICISVSFALSYVKFFSMPQGGSVTFASLLPLALYSYMFGTRKGVVAGVVYGLLQFVQSPQFYQPMQVLLDYPIAFASIGLAGIFRNAKFLKGVQIKFALGTIIAVLFRYVSHTISGYFVFYSWSAGQNPLVYSLVYNSYVAVDLAIVLVMGVVALSSRNLQKTVLAAGVA